MCATPVFDAVAWMDDPVPRQAELNMALDQALLASLAQAGSTAVAVLRVYRWERAAISIGYFEKLATTGAIFPDRCCVRRWTGGGTVEHGDDLTYSILVPSARIPAGWRPRKAYEEIHGAVAAALRLAGVERADLVGPDAGNHTEAQSTSSPECFRNPVAADVMIGDRKIAGAAQRWTKFGLLHQGSVQRGDEMRPGGPLYEAVREALPFAIARQPEPRALTDAVLEQAIELVRTRYGTCEWLKKY